MFEAVFAVGAVAFSVLSLLTALNVHHHNETLDLRLEALENENETFKLFFKKLDVKLPAKAKPRKAKPAVKVKAEANA